MIIPSVSPIQKSRIATNNLSIESAPQKYSTAQYKHDERVAPAGIKIKNATALASRICFRLNFILFLTNKARLTYTNVKRRSAVMVTETLRRTPATNKSTRTAPMKTNGANMTLSMSTTKLKALSGLHSVIPSRSRSYHSVSRFNAR